MYFKLKMAVTRSILELEKNFKNLNSWKNNFNLGLFSSFLLSVKRFLSYRQKTPFFPWNLGLLGKNLAHFLIAPSNNSKKCQISCKSSLSHNFYTYLGSQVNHDQCFYKFIIWYSLVCVNQYFRLEKQPFRVKSDQAMM